MPASFRVWVITQPLAELFQMAPAKVNASINRTLKVIGERFCGTFTITRLKGPPGIEIRRRTRSRKRQGFRVPWEMRSVGFYGRIYQRRELNGKKLAIGTRNPQVMIHETGGTITPSKKSALAVHIRTPAAAQMVGGKVGDIRLAKRVRLKPRLEFISTWQSFITSVAPVYLARGFREAIRVAATRGQGVADPEGPIE